MSGGTLYRIAGHPECGLFPSAIAAVLYAIEHGIDAGWEAAS